MWRRQLSKKSKSIGTYPHSYELCYSVTWMCVPHAADTVLDRRIWSSQRESLPWGLHGSGRGTDWAQGYFNVPARELTWSDLSPKQHVGLDSCVNTHIHTHAPSPLVRFLSYRKNKSQPIEGRSRFRRPWKALMAGGRVIQSLGYLLYNYLRSKHTNLAHALNIICKAA